MSQPRHPFCYALLALCLLHLGFFAWQQAGSISAISGLLYANGTPVGGDFINLWTAGRLVLEGRFGEIYDYAAFMAQEVELTGAPIGVRFWAYPPHSLLFAWPFGLVGFYPALLAWSLMGLLVLALGCRRLGMDRLETLIVLISPASVLCLFYGQTGNLGTGLLLLALAGGRGRDVPAIVAAAFLTMKPQMGFLLPLYWLAERRWVRLVVTSLAVLAILAVTLILPGLEAWRAYLGQTLPGLSQLERHGTGPFITMIPSIFMALRIVTGDGDLAIRLHILFAVPIVVLALWRLWRLDDHLRRVAVMLAATVLVTPYLHNYDLTMLAVAALLVLRRFPPGARGEVLVAILVGGLIGLPQLVVLFNLSGFPVSPLLILPLLLLA